MEIGFQEKQFSWEMESSLFFVPPKSQFSERVCLGEKGKTVRSMPQCFWPIGLYPIGSMYGIFTYIYHKNQPNVAKYTIHGSYGY